MPINGYILSPTLFFLHFVHKRTVIHGKTPYSPVGSCGVNLNGYLYDARDGIVSNSVKSYIGLKVKQLFDPPQSSAVIESMKNQIAEYEFRMLTQVSVDKRKGV